NRGRNFLEKVPSPNPIFKNFQNELDSLKICIFFVIFISDGSFLKGVRGKAFSRKSFPRELD
ncbi:MAG: hypothetical protein J6N32_11590, partial [Clostridia bacterium]|nr:hypothetical protein [Clostridia bacterium]